MNLNQLIRAIDALVPQQPKDLTGGESEALLAMKVKVKSVGELQVRALLNILIVDAVLFFNVGKSMGKQQVVQTVDLIMDDNGFNYKHLKPEDFKLCFINACKGHYNENGLFDRIDGQIVLNWLMQYDNQRDAEIETIRARQNRDFKKEQEKGAPLMIAAASGQFDEDYVFKSNMAKLKQQLEDSKRKRDAEAIELAKEVNNKGPIYDMHQRWIKQFEDLWKRQGYPKKRTVKKYGMVKNPFWFPDNNSDWRPKMIRKELDINAYLEHKQWQYMLAMSPLKNRIKIYLKEK